MNITADLDEPVPIQTIVPFSAVDRDNDVSNTNKTSILDGRIKIYSMILCNILFLLFRNFKRNC